MKFMEYLTKKQRYEISLMLQASVKKHSVIISKTRVVYSSKKSSSNHKNLYICARKKVIKKTFRTGTTPNSLFLTQ